MLETELTTDRATRAETLYLEAALEMTRLNRAMRRACKYVLIDGMTPAEAGRRVKRPRQNVYRALLRVRPRLAEVKAYGASLSNTS